MILFVLGPDPARLRLRIAPDGSARMDGAILVVSAADGPMPDDPGPPRRLVARGAPAEAECADADGNGRAGLVRAAADFADARSGEHVPVALATTPGQDLDASGRYDVVLRIGDEQATREARVRLAVRGRARRAGRRRDSPAP